MIASIIGFILDAISAAMKAVGDKEIAHEQVLAELAAALHSTGDKVSALGTHFLMSDLSLEEKLKAIEDARSKLYAPAVPVFPEPSEPSE